MKSIYKVCIALSLLIGVAITGCKKYLVESNPAGRTAETYYNTQQGFEQLVEANYPNLRPIINYQSLYWTGTDIYSSYGINDINYLNLYTKSFNSSDGNVSGLWSQLYYSINIANTTLYWATQVTGEPAVTLGYRVGEAKTLRAYYYFLLAETFGGVPIVTQPTTAPTFNFVRAAESDVYKQIISDLTDAIAVLPATSPDAGRVTLGVAEHLLAKVYLTRAYKSYGGGNADFTLAAKYADAVIAGPYALQPVFANLFDPTVSNYQGSNEIIWAVQYSTNPLTNGAGNSLNQACLWDTQSIPELGRSSLYGKPNYTNAPTPFLFNLYDKNKDSRYLATFWNVLYCQTAANGFNVGDTVVFYPNFDLSAAQISAKKYFTVNPDQYRTPGSFSFSTLNRCYPEPKKFREPNLPYQDNGGFRNTYIFRLAETYLMDAEANLQLGNTSRALQLFNAIRARAAKPGNDPATNVAYATEMQVSALSINDILDERARELFGEELRWFELKRTGTLITRVLADNDEAKASNTIDSHFLLRPIPQTVIDLNQAPFPQNPGY
jgi:hypothetical protein